MRDIVRFGIIKPHPQVSNASAPPQAVRVHYYATIEVTNESIVMHLVALSCHGIQSVFNRMHQ